MDYNGLIFTGNAWLNMIGKKCNLNQFGPNKWDILQIVQSCPIKLILPNLPPFQSLGRGPLFLLLAVISTYVALVQRRWGLDQPRPRPQVGAPESPLPFFPFPALEDTLRFKRCRWLATVKFARPKNDPTNWQNVRLSHEIRLRLCPFWSGLVQTHCWWPAVRHYCNTETDGGQITYALEIGSNRSCSQ